MLQVLAARRQLITILVLQEFFLLSLGKMAALEAARQQGVVFLRLQQHFYPVVAAEMVPPGWGQPFLSIMVIQHLLRLPQGLIRERTVFSSHSPYWLGVVVPVERRLLLLAELGVVVGSVAVAEGLVKTPTPVVVAVTAQYLFGLGDYENSRIRNQ
jgi:hypothetical protein